MLAAFVISVLPSFLLVQFSWRREGLTGDRAPGPQKFHVHPVSRVGVIGVLIAIAGIVILDTLIPADQGSGSALRVDSRVMFLLGCSLIAFAGGFAEDITRYVSVRIRLGATMLARNTDYP